MAAYRHRATWRSITFNDHLVDDGTKALDDPANIVEAKLNDSYYLDELDINRVSAQDYRELRQFLEGAEPNEAFEGVRAITAAGIINALSPGELEDKAWALNEAFSIAACRLAAQSLDPKGVLPFDFKRDTGSALATKALRFYARPGPARPVWIGRRREGLSRPFSFQLISFDPFAFDQSETQTTVTAGGTVTNPGNIYTRPKIRITFTGAGSATLTITNTTTGKAIVIDASAAANGNVYLIDTAKSTMILVADGTSRYSKLTSGFLSDQFLLAGANTITVANATNVSQIRFEFRGAYA